MRAFLSYSHADADFANRLVFDLKANNINVWQDVKEIEPGASIIASIEGVLGSCETVLLVLSPHSVASRWVQEEYRAALTLQRASKDKRPLIIPLVLRDCAIPLFLKDIRWIDFRHQYEPAFTQLAAAMNAKTNIIPSSQIVRFTQALIIRTQLTFETLKGAQAEGKLLPNYSFVEQFRNLEEALARALEIEAYAYRQYGFIDAKYWQVPDSSESVDGKPQLYTDMATHRAFMTSVCRVVARIVQLGERLGAQSWLPASYHELVAYLGLPTDHEFFDQLREYEENATGEANISD
jgi:hypothetical protein